MILNLLKLVFLYFIYRFIKVMIKSFIKKKLRDTAKKMQDQMNEGFGQHNGESAGGQGPNKPVNKSPKTFEAEYKVLKD
jgi:hypothetical protein